MTDLSYPIGPFTDHARDRTTAAEQAGLMDEIAAAPAGYAQPWRDSMMLS